jgi:hypothetical protein
MRRIGAGASQFAVVIDRGHEALFVLSMTLSENRFPLFRVML